VTGGQIAALVFAILLLLPGGCFLFFGIGLASDSSLGGLSAMMLLVAAAILGGAGLLFWVAFRRRPGSGETP
jgi:membrane protein implicated in regulation of membrane protease activity